MLFDIFAHLVYNFGRVCLSVCLSVCMNVCPLSDDNIRKPWRRKVHFRSSGVSPGSSSHMKVIGSRSRPREQKNVENPYICNVKFRLTITPLLTHRDVKFACSMGFSDTADQMVWPSSLSRDRKWPGVDKCTHLQVVALRLEGNLVLLWINLMLLCI